MKTEIRTFCDEYAEALQPFAGEIARALRALPDEGPIPELRRWRLRLQEVAHRTETLSGKISEQQAYLLIFGPLKSGKSTLMNAISGSYVSEVSSLPAYPALVYVRHGQERSFRATTYAGEQLEFANSQAMADAVLEGHAELARRILEVERNGESFDPQVHYPSAIRRLDVQTPAESLAESGSALVDTPGLYTRMRFGYDVMTRDFRDTASCAIFVVKSDNLFFEKVFEEFNQLLGLFSRIFLVVNIDGSKRDLDADGDLVPSLESQNPQAIVEAFQSLAMSAPLREAFEEGRLNVYPIDLLRAASRQIKLQARGIGMQEDAEKKSAGHGFDEFLSDLTEYLNSSDYLREFMLDSLRVGESLRDEILDIASGEAEGRLQSELASQDQEFEDAHAQLAALKTLESIDWEKAFEEVHREKDRLLSEVSEERYEKLSSTLSEDLDRWLDSDDSLRALRDDYLNRHIEQETADDAKAMIDRLKARVGGREGGARFTPEESDAFDCTGIRLDQLPGEAVSEPESSDSDEGRHFDLAPEDVPLKRSVMDVLLFRSHKTVRERFFGPQGTEFVPASKKRKRMSGKHLEALQERVTAFPRNELPQILSAYLDRILRAHVDRLKNCVDQECVERRQKLGHRIEELDKERKGIRSTQRVFEQLSQSAKGFAAALEERKERFQTEAESETEPDPATAYQSTDSEQEDDALAVDPDQLEAAKERIETLEAESKAERDR